MTTLWQDVVYGFRMLMKKPGFTAIAAFSLALGIGANTAIFSLVNTVLLSSLNYRDPSRLVMVETTPPGHPETSEPATVPDYIAWQEQNRSFEMLGADDGGLLDLGVGENGRAPERLEGEGFSPAVFKILGVMAHSVAQRTREIGIRMALGAHWADVIQLVMWNALLLIGTGLVVGLGGSLALTRLIATRLWGVTPTDPATFASVAVLLAVVAVLATLIPARRAVLVDPTIALRYD